MSLAGPLYLDAADPAVVHHDGRYYLFSTNNHLRAPVTVLDDLVEPLALWQKNLRTSEAMPNKPAWTQSDHQLWAPTVDRVGSRWVMFFAADRPNPPQPHNAQCIGRAFADDPAGPYVADPHPFHCGIFAATGALDPDLFRDHQGRWWLHVAIGGTRTPLHAIRLDGNANSVGVEQVVLGSRHGWEYHFVENPSMFYDAPRGNYVLTYSAGLWSDPQYSTGVARCATPAGPCASDPSGPWARSASGRTGPGGMSFVRGTSEPLVAFHSFAQGAEAPVGARHTSVMRFSPHPIGLSELIR